MADKKRRTGSLGWGRRRPREAVAADEGGDREPPASQGALPPAGRMEKDAGLRPAGRPADSRTTSPGRDSPGSGDEAPGSRQAEAQAEEASLISSSGVEDAPKPPDPEDADGDDSLLDLFTQEAVVNEELRLLAEGLEEIEIGILAQQCKDVAARLRQRG